MKFTVQNFLQAVRPWWYVLLA